MDLGNVPVLLMVCLFSLRIWESIGLPVCSLKPYHASEQVCCNGTLSNVTQWYNGKLARMSCCKDLQLYNGDTELCCGPQVGVPKFGVYNGVKYERKCCEHSGRIAEPHRGQECCSGHFVENMDNNTGCCGNESYSVVKEFCCEIVLDQKYQIYPSPGDETSDCCGLQKFSTKEKWCSKPNFTLHSEGTKTCGIDPYDDEKYICCYEDGSLKQAENKAECIVMRPTCFKWTHDFEARNRLWETLMERPKFQPPDQYAVSPDYQCREGIIYDANHQHFQPSNKSPRIKAHVFPKDHKSCGNSSYNPNAEGHQEFCCQSTVRNASIDVNVACCGRELYNKDREQCCGNRIVDQTKGCCNNRDIYTKGEKDCCANNLFDPHSQVCCNEVSSYGYPINKTYKNHTDCCVLGNGGLISFNKWDKPFMECKNGKLQRKSEEKENPCLDGKRDIGQENCCGNHMINRTTQVCCKTRSNSLYPKNKTMSKHSGCCVLKSGDTVTFNKRLENCSNGRLKPKLRESNLKPCLCSKRGTVKQMRNTCDKKKEYIIRAVNASIDGNGTTLAVTILKPLAFQGRTMELQIPYQCRCLKAGKVFRVITNRRLHKRKGASLTQKDMIVKNSKENRKLRNVLCHKNFRGLRKNVTNNRKRHG